MSDLKQSTTTFLAGNWSESKRRIVLGLGAAMFVGGWAMTWYFGDQVSIDYELGTVQNDHGVIQFVCIVCMAVGAGLLGLGFPKTKN